LIGSEKERTVEKSLESLRNSFFIFLCSKVCQGKGEKSKVSGILNMLAKDGKAQED